VPKIDNNPQSEFEAETIKVDGFLETNMKVP
jgi:hypothetical protein